MLISEMNIVWIDALVIDKGFEKKGVIKDLALKEVKVIVVGANRRGAPYASENGDCGRSSVLASLLKGCVSAIRAYYG